MRYVFYFLTMTVLFAGGMLVGNVYLPQRSAALSATASVPDLSDKNPILKNTSQESANQELTQLNQALSACPVIVSDEKDRLVNHIKLQLALMDFQLKKTRLEMEMAKNIDTNRPTSQLMDAAQQYNNARQYVENLANMLFPIPPQEETQNQPSVETNSSTTTATK